MENNNPPIMEQPQESMVPMMDQPLFATSFDQQPQPTMENNSQQINTVGEPQQVQSFEFNVQPNMQTALSKAQTRKPKSPNKSVAS